ncbi:MAG: hypothetical protein K2F91_00680 [Muribaculaceae bacterium]|nr:hypothetical protein [Muribaculaceae bacterium]
MKVLSIGTSPDGKTLVEAGVDSAVLRPGEPVFVPEPTSDWNSSAVPVVRIGRLGMSITEARARDYYHELTLFHMLTPVSPDAAEGLPPFILDRALSPGRWLDISAAPSDRRFVLSATRSPIGGSDSDVLSAEASLADLGVDRVVALLSRHLTFKTGDLLVFRDCRLDFGSPQLDTEIKAAVDGEEVLDIRIK